MDDFATNFCHLSPTFQGSNNGIIVSRVFMGTRAIVFLYVAVNTPYFASRTLTTNKRYLKYDGDSLHPAFLDSTFQRSIGSDRRNTEPRYLFMRKVDVRTQSGRDLVKWALDEHIRRHILLPVRNGRMVNAVHPPVVKVAEGEAVAAFGGDGDVQEEARRGREVYPGYGALGGEKWVVRSGSDLVA